LKLLVATDVAARGLDIPDVSHIFNFDLPWQPDDYVHRIGRTGRAGKEGVSTSLVTTDELKSLKDIEKMLGEPVAWIGEAPSDEDFAAAGKKRRGRGGRTGPQRGRGGRSSGAPAQARGDDKPRHGERRGGGGQRGGERREPRPEARPESRPEARPEQRAEQREPRREQRAEHREQPRAARPQPPQPTARAADGGQRQQSRNGHADAKPAAQPRGERQQRPERSHERQPEGGRSGFADNVPAFLRNPVKRPAKVAGE
jgi:superfamily II DNA/RNA helicase